MTPKEAIELLHPNTTKEAIRRIEENGGNAIEAVEEACIVACEAIEKQIPKKPIALTNRYPDGQYECPVCGNMVGYPTFRDTPFGEIVGEPVKYDYCSKCGQRLKWGENDDE